MSTELTLSDLNDAALDISLPNYDGIWEDLCSRWKDEMLSPTYRMPERDKVTGPKAGLPDGTVIQFSRIVARVGYEFGIHSISRQQWFEAGLAIIVRATGLPSETVKHVICALNTDSPFKGIKHEIYNAIVRPLIEKTPAETRNVRAMWFYNYPELQTGTIIKRVKKLTGKRESGFYGGGSWDSEPEWEPPYLGWKHTQPLYEVSLPITYDGPVKALVYPADTTEAGR